MQGWGTWQIAKIYGAGNIKAVRPSTKRREEEETK